eukprot:1950438-Prorocentrum_lima.AAC.1
MTALDYAMEAGEEEIVDLLRMYNHELGYIAEEAASRQEQEEEAHRRTQMLANRYSTHQHDRAAFFASDDRPSFPLQIRLHRC